MDNTIYQLIITALITWIGSYVGLAVNNRRSEQKRRDEANELKEAAERQDLERRQHDDKLRNELVQKLINLNDEQAKEVREIRSEWTLERAAMQQREKEQQKILTSERDEYRRRLDERDEVNRTILIENAKILSLMQNLTAENESLRKGLEELQIKVNGYADLQRQLVEALQENEALKTQIDTMRLEVDQLSGKVTTLESTIVSLEETIKTLTKQRDDLIKENGHLKESLERTENELRERVKALEQANKVKATDTQSINPTLVLTAPDSAIKPEGSSPL